MIAAPQATSTRPYLVRALYEWCTDNGYTPYVAVAVNEQVQVPREYVKDGEIVLNISFDATTSLKLGNEFIEFKARFGGVARDITVPMGQVLAIYARENGMGMAFPIESAEAARLTALPQVQTTEPRAGGLTRVESEPRPDGSGDGNDPHRPPPPGSRPALKRVK